MSNSLEYKGYLGSIECDSENECFYGKVLFINDSIYYQGKAFEELKQCFCNAVDEYLETCEEMGRDPDKPFSGSFNVRIGQQLHRKLAYKTTRKGIAINAGVIEALTHYLEDTRPQTEVIHKHVYFHADYCDLPDYSFEPDSRNFTLSLIEGSKTH